eukprot:scaffold21438_cov60-Cyclotella_meneghiniana.AAC.4
MLSIASVLAVNDSPVFLLTQPQQSSSLMGQNIFYSASSIVVNSSFHAFQVPRHRRKKFDLRRIRTVELTTDHTSPRQLHLMLEIIPRQIMTSSQSKVKPNV